jgi:hypothetical protein
MDGRCHRAGGRAKKITAKFKDLRRVLRAWHSQLSNLTATITNTKNVLMFLDILEEFRDSVRSLLDAEGVTKLKHEDKTMILWE